MRSMRSLFPMMTAGVGEGAGERLRARARARERGGTRMCLRMCLRVRVHARVSVCVWGGGGYAVFTRAPRTSAIALADAVGDNTGRGGAIRV